MVQLASYVGRVLFFLVIHFAKRMSVNQYIHVVGSKTAIAIALDLRECNPYSTKFCGSYVPCGLYNKLFFFLFSAM